MVSLQNLEETFTYGNIIENMSATCTSKYITEYTTRYVKEMRYRFGVKEKLRYQRKVNYMKLCHDHHHAVADIAADYIWHNYDKKHIGGALPEKVCQLVSSCPK